MTSPALSPWTYLRRYRGSVILGCLSLLATSALSLAVPYLLGRTIEGLRGDDPGGAVPPLALAMIGFALAQALARIASRLLLFNAARNAEFDLRSDLFGHLLVQAPSFYRKHTVGDIMSRLTTDVQTVRALWGPGVLNVVNTTFLFTTAVVLMINIDAELALWALTPYPLMVLVGRAFAGRLYKHSHDVQEYLGTVSDKVQEDLSGIGVIKTYTAEPERKQRFAGMADELLDRNMKLTMIRGQLMPVLGGLGSLGAVIILYMGGAAVISGRIDLGQLVQFNAYLALLVWPTLAFGWMLSLFQRGFAAWRRLAVLLEAEPTIQDGDGPDLPIETVRGDVDIRHLTIELEGRKVLDDVSLSMKAGTVTAIVGRTGSGKSLLVEALPRLFEVPPGTLFLDEHDITSLSLASLRRAIGYAPQEAYLFSTSIAQNIGHGIEHTRETGDDLLGITRAAGAAGMTGDLSQFPAGIDTMVGERGITLSGGQRQRVALARALASDPRVLILDDSLSSVDTQTEREILTALDGIMHGRTSILISHRVAAIKRADQIVVIDAGKVAEVGTHDELLARAGVYAELYRTQLVDDTCEEGVA